MPTITTSSPLPMGTVGSAYNETILAVKSGVNLNVTRGPVIPDGGEDDLEDISTGVGTDFTYNINSIGDDDLDSISLVVQNQVNCTVIISSAPSSGPIEPLSSTTFTLTVVPILDGPFSFEVEITSDADVPAANPYTFDVVGVGVFLDLLNAGETFMFSIDSEFVVADPFGPGIDDDVIFDEPFLFLPD